MIIRLAEEEDFNAIWEIFHSVIQSGDTYVFDPETPEGDLKKHWMAPYMQTFVLEANGDILGTYIIKPNQIDLGAHIANCSYMVHPNARRKGYGRKMCEHSIQIAKDSGFLAIQFNIVVSSNTGAIKLWEEFGFEIIGTIPKAFRHKRLGLIDAYILYKPIH